MTGSTGALPVTNRANRNQLTEEENFSGVNFGDYTLILPPCGTLLLVSFSKRNYRRSSCSSASHFQNKHAIQILRRQLKIFRHGVVHDQDGLNLITAGAIGCSQTFCANTVDELSGMSTRFSCCVYFPFLPPTLAPRLISSAKKCFR